MAYNTKLYRSTGSAWEEVRVGSEWGLIANKPTNFPPTSHTHPEYVKTSGNQTITGIKQIDNSDLRMNGGSVSYLRPATTGGWARGFWWQKNATDDVPYQRIGGIGVLGNNLSVSKFYIGYGESPWSNSILEAFPDYVNINGDLEATGSIKINGNNVLTGVTNYLNINGETVGFYSAVTQTTKAVYAATSQLSTSIAKRYLIGTQSTTSLAVQNCNTNVYMQSGKIYSAPTLDSDSDNTVATKGYVDSKSSLHRVVTITSSITIDDNYKHNDLIICNNSSDIQINISSYANHPIGTRIDFYRRGFGGVKFSGSIITKSSHYYIKERYMAASLIKISQTEWLLIGALSTS